MAIYTRKGDRGRTTLGMGEDAEKTSLPIAALGDADELNSFIGLCRQFCSPENSSLLGQVQNDLFRIQAEIGGMDSGYQPINSKDVEFLERNIDSIDSRLPLLHKFILPGGSRPAAVLHVARAVCRRAERTMFALDSQRPLGSMTMVYINRLSTLLFVLARLENSAEGAKEESPDYSARNI